MSRRKALWAFFIALPGLIFASGCASPWEQYEDSLYVTLKEPGAEMYAQHSKLLAEIVEQYESDGKKPPPGVLAEHALYLARLGRTEEARRYFAAEKNAYPESAVFVTALERTIEGHRAFTPDEEKAEESP